MQILQAEKIATVDDQSKRICDGCGKRMTRVKLIFESETGDVIHMFECSCGERIWIE